MKKERESLTPLENGAAEQKESTRLRPLNNAEVPSFDCLSEANICDLSGIEVDAGHSNHFKQDINGLNSRLEKYTRHVRKNELLVAEATAATEAIEIQIRQVRQQHVEHVDMLRAELEARLRQTVRGEDQLKCLQQDCEEIENRRKLLKGQLSEARKREASLDRAIIAERSSLKCLQEELSQLREKNCRDQNNTKGLTEEASTLKVENAKLKENVENATSELTLQEHKVSEVEKQFVFTSDEVSKKLLTERNLHEEITLKKLTEMRSQFEKDSLALKESLQNAFEKKRSDHVDAEKHARLMTEFLAKQKYLDGISLQIEQREKQIVDKIQEVDDARVVYEKVFQKEKKKTDSVEKKLRNNARSYEDICQELDTYRGLIDSLKIAGNDETSICPITPTSVGGKRGRMPDSRMTDFNVNLSRKPESNLQSKIERKIRTPKRIIQSQNRAQ